MVYGHGGDFAANPSSMGMAVIMSIANLIQFVASSVFFAWCAWRIADSGIWRALFIVRAITPLVSTSFMLSWAYSFGRLQYLSLMTYGPALFRAAVQLIVEI